MQDDWKTKLTPEQYHVLREKGTEAPFTGKYVDMHDNGMYTCAACGTPLFSSDTKFESHSGWPSFYEVAEKGNVVLKDDNSLGMHRVEVECAKCGGHLGHLFDDGPSDKTGKRFCINSCALEFKKKD
ncbi:peptide-methionine (R)-S-oxide reductase MsrB [Candidatus Microgenomates bacterium]|nr:peptide-methionine (R)-S-oxide reductase MsrB [Candidatus Microgenomates bacterium]